MPPTDQIEGLGETIALSNEKVVGDFDKERGGESLIRVVSGENRVKGVERKQTAFLECFTLKFFKYAERVKDVYIGYPPPRFYIEL